MNIREKILVIEDEKSIARFISTILTANGYEAMRAASGAEAMSMISSHCPDLVILDLGLPDMDGLDILRQLRSWSTLPVVVVSARSHEQDKVSALDLGADDYLTKPFGTDELLARVRPRHWYWCPAGPPGRNGAGCSPASTAPPAPPRSQCPMSPASVSASCRPSSPLIYARSSAGCSRRPKYHKMSSTIRRQACPSP